MKHFAILYFLLSFAHAGETIVAQCAPLDSERGPARDERYYEVLQNTQTKKYFLVEYVPMEIPGSCRYRSGCEYEWIENDEYLLTRTSDSRYVRFKFNSDFMLRFERDSSRAFFLNLDHGKWTPTEELKCKFKGDLK